VKRIEQQVWNVDSAKGVSHGVRRNGWERWQAFQMVLIRTNYRYLSFFVRQEYWYSIILGSCNSEIKPLYYF